MKTKLKYYWEVGSKTVVRDNGRTRLRCYTSLDGSLFSSRRFITGLYDEGSGFKLGDECTPRITYRQYLMWFVGFVNDPTEWKSK